jgi:hypothetical protein
MKISKEMRCNNCAGSTTPERCDLADGRFTSSVANDILPDGAPEWCPVRKLEQSPEYRTSSCREIGKMGRRRNAVR